MRFCLSYFGPKEIFQLRRDFFLAVKYGLESIGHTVDFAWMSVDKSSFNLIVGAYFLPKEQIRLITESALQFACINTEVIAQDSLNYQSEKCDFLGSYLPCMQAGQFVWEVIYDNLTHHNHYKTKALFLRWGWDPKMEEIEHQTEKENDFYFFGSMTPRRAGIVDNLAKRGFIGRVDHACPTFFRNDRIAKSKVILNLIQNDRYTHVNSFRICYLANNRCAILSEIENDPANYLAVSRRARKDDIADVLSDLVTNKKWMVLAEQGYEKFRATPMKTCMEQLLDKSFSKTVFEDSGA